MPIKTSFENASVAFMWKPSLIESIAGYASIFGLLFLVAIAIDGIFLGGNSLTWLMIAITMWILKPFLDEDLYKENAIQEPFNVIEPNAHVVEEGDEIGE